MFFFHVNSATKVLWPGQVLFPFKWKHSISTTHNVLQPQTAASFKNVDLSSQPKMANRNHCWLLMIHDVLRRNRAAIKALMHCANPLPSSLVVWRRQKFKRRFSVDLLISFKGLTGCNDKAKLVSKKPLWKEFNLSRSRRCRKSWTWIAMEFWARPNSRARPQQGMDMKFPVGMALIWAQGMFSWWVYNDFKTSNEIPNPFH